MLKTITFDLLTERLQKRKSQTLSTQCLLNLNSTKYFAFRKDNLITTHSGFEPHMCYGKISVSFLFKSDEDSASNKRRDSVDSTSSGGPPIEIATDALSETNNLSPTEDFQSHHFVRTNFRTYTVCDYCNKKIWLKEAFACRICQMKCHKKCNDRCIANTICRGEGFYPSITNMKNPNQITPEIITTGEDEIQDDGNSDAGSLSNYSMRSLVCKIYFVLDIRIEFQVFFVLHIFVTFPATKQSGSSCIRL